MQLPHGKSLCFQFSLFAVLLPHQRYVRSAYKIAGILIYLLCFGMEPSGLSLGAITNSSACSNDCQLNGEKTIEKIISEVHQKQ